MVQIQDITSVDDDVARSGERLRLAGNAAYASGDFEAAVRSYRESLEAAPPPSPSAPFALGNRAKALLKLGRTGEALADAERCVTACPPGSPYAAKARFRMGEALEATGALDRARDAYRDACGEAPGDRDALGALRRISEAIHARDTNTTSARETTRNDAKRRDRRDDDDGERAFSRAKRLLREKRYEEALRDFEAYVPPPARLDRKLSLLLNRAYAYTELGRHEEALRDARAAVRADRESSRARYRLGAAALAAAEAANAEATRLFADRAGGSRDDESHDESTVLSSKLTTRDVVANLRSSAEALVAEARDEGFKYGSLLSGLDDDDANLFADGLAKCASILAIADEWVMVEPEAPASAPASTPASAPASTPASTPASAPASTPASAPASAPPTPKRLQRNETTSRKTSSKKTSVPAVAATVPVSSLAAYARRETARREEEPFSFSENVFEDDPEETRRVDADVARFRDSVRVFGCAIVRLPDTLAEEKEKSDIRKTPRDVFADACAAASAFFRMRPAEKARSLPNARTAPHGYLRPLEETRADSALGSGEALRHARRDETMLERFSACEAFDAAYVWPSAEFKARLDDARGVLEATAKAAGDAFLIERFAEIEAGGDFRRSRGGGATAENIKEYENALGSILLAPENQRITLAWHPTRPRLSSEDKSEDERERERERYDDDDATAELRAALAPVASAGEAEPERAFLSFFPRVLPSDSVGDQHGGPRLGKDTLKKTRTPSARVRCGRAETSFSAAAETESAAENDVLVVAGERFRDIMGDAWTTPTVSFDREDEEGSCVRLVYRV